MLEGVTLNTSAEVVHYDGQNDVLWIEVESEAGEQVLLKFPHVAGFRCEPVPAGRPQHGRTLREATDSDWLKKMRADAAGELAAKLREFILTGPARNWHVAASDCRHVQGDAAAAKD